MTSASESGDSNHWMMNSLSSDDDVKKTAREQTELLRALLEKRLSTDLDEQLADSSRRIRAYLMHQRIGRNPRRLRDLRSIGYSSEDLLHFRENPNWFPSRGIVDDVAALRADQDEILDDLRVAVIRLMAEEHPNILLELALAALREKRTVVSDNPRILKALAELLIDALGAIERAPLNKEASTTPKNVGDIDPRVEEDVKGSDEHNE